MEVDWVLLVGFNYTISILKYISLYFLFGVGATEN